MIFTNGMNYGVTKDVFLREYKICYANLNSVRVNNGFTIGNATSIDKSKSMAMKKCYSEFLERYALGLPIGKAKAIDAIGLRSGEIAKIDLRVFGYGNSEYGHSDTTATATGVDSEKVKEKAVLELLEKTGMAVRILSGDKKSIDKEALQYLAASYSKRHNTEMICENNIDIYHNHFFELSREEFLEAYNYLFSFPQISISEIENVKISRKEVIKNIYKQWDLDPFIVVLDGRENMGIKVVKIFDDEWFPHMYPTLYEEDCVRTLEKRFEKSMKQNLKIIPFA